MKTCKHNDHKKLFFSKEVLHLSDDQNSTLSFVYLSCMEFRRVLTRNVKYRVFVTP